MKNLITGILILFFFIGCADRSDKDWLSPGDMKEDIRYFFHMIRDIHPDPYQRYDSMTFVTLEKKMIESCSVPMAREEFGWRLMKVRKFLDGHVAVFGFFSDLGRYRFPAVEFRGDQMLLRSDTLLAVRDSFASYTALDIDSMIPWDQPSRFRNENMNLLLNLLLSPANKSTMTYTGVVKTSNGSRDTTICVDTHRIINDSVYSKPYASAFHPEDSIAVLYYNTCMIYGEDNVKQYRGFVDAFFSELKSKHIKYLFIDVTHNGGGSDGNNSVIINHLRTDESITKVRMTGKKAGVEKYLKSDLVKKFFDENEAEKNYWMERFGNPIMEKGIAFMEESTPANKSGYDGNVFVIMGNKTYSAGANFCLAIKQSHAAVLVGEEAGQYYPICGNVIRSALPNSKIQYQIPATETFYKPSALFEEGDIQPDIYYSIEEFLNVNNYKEIVKRCCKTVCYVR